MKIHHSTETVNCGVDSFPYTRSEIKSKIDGKEQNRATELIRMLVRWSLCTRFIFWLQFHVLKLGPGGVALVMILGISIALVISQADMSGSWGMLLTTVLIGLSPAVSRLSLAQ